MQLTRKGKTTVESVAELAMRLGGKHPADYGSTRSQHDFTKRQLMACLILRVYLKTTYRGVLELLAVSPKLREALGMPDKLPHCTTLQKFSARSQVLAIADAMIWTIGRAAGEPRFAKTSAAMDATGMETTTASAHFQSRAAQTRRKWVKVSTIVLCGSLLPLSLVLGWGPGNDKCQARELLAKANEATLPAKFFAGAGYDAGWVHDQCRLDWGAESVIKPARQRAGGPRSGFWRSRMSERNLEWKGYGSRRAVKSFFSGLKRTMGSTLTSRKPSQLLAEAAFKVLAYTLRR